MSFDRENNTTQNTLCQYIFEIKVCVSSIDILKKILFLTEMALSQVKMLKNYAKKAFQKVYFVL